ncbi:NAD(P)-dependent oxidoreductase [Bacillus sp. FJAT-42376]|uniref:NAD(P)-dependent oxidoreductase n=1 Tax=Bacillus sp. FJAT-42376 TaxID=2014076 RepID=UPI000F4DE78E|nr:NAD(P)-binding oxidoreductase [Bacillus sp. FJAT-42376]AZB40998.1 NAD(P)-dependent oxidoreductase [Bacillus sp. FJAT-42376]
MNITVFGASGGTGIELVKQAADQGHLIKAFVRTPSKFPFKTEPAIEMIHGNALDRSAVNQAVKGSDAVISCLGADGLNKTTALSDMTSNILEAMKESGIQRLGYVASAGIDREIPGLRGKMAAFFLRNVLDDHRKAAELMKESGMEWTIARPMRLMDEPLTGVYRTSLESVPENGQKISRADVAHFILSSIQNHTFIRKSVGLAY